MTPTNDITIPIEWTVAHTLATIAVVAILVIGVAWTLLDRRRTRPVERIVWVIVQVALPVVGFVLWLFLASPIGRRTDEPKSEAH